ncbi:hypothetical protein BUALT_Bualt12G0145800 [Buddleja alternifolia]|uniref:Embryo sac development arrest 6 n=1 Tax=Buddleja alternifolia TaxID=168488 RepID=A0AAV6X1Y3_9LAMI|nr:hypothetical protein BUALT_Bualt12G0145800 [Buddleja alternifolia]
MSYHHSRRLLTPGTSSRKRKEMEALHPPTSSKTFVQPAAVSGTKFATTSSSRSAPLSSNRLLAGYMAYEFLTKGTLFGQIFDPARAEPNPVAADRHQYKIRNRLHSSAEAEPSVKPKPKPNGYAEVAWLMKSEGAHIPGVVNPTQLAGWIDEM